MLFLFIFYLTPVCFLCLMLHLQMGDESEPVTTWREGPQHFKATVNHSFSLFCFHPWFWNIGSSFVIVCYLACSSILKSLPFLVRLFDSSHIWISHLFPCGRTLLSHLSSLISLHRPQITAPLRLVPGTMLDPNPVYCLSSVPALVLPNFPYYVFVSHSI